MTKSLCACGNCSAISIEAALNEIEDSWERGIDGDSADNESPGECPVCGALVALCDGGYDRRLPGFSDFAAAVVGEQRLKLIPTVQIRDLDRTDWRLKRCVKVQVSFYRKASDSVSLARRGELDPLWTSSFTDIKKALAEARRFVVVARSGLVS